MSSVILSALLTLVTCVGYVMNIVKGVGLGIAAGAAVAAVSSKMMQGKKSAKARSKEMRKNTAKAVHTVGQLIDGVEHMLK